MPCSCLVGPPQTYWCDPPGQYLPEFRAERFRLPYAFAPFRPVVSDVRLSTADPAAPAPATMPVFGYGQDVAITYRYAGERREHAQACTDPCGTCR